MISIILLLLARVETMPSTVTHFFDLMRMKKIYANKEPRFFIHLTQKQYLDVKLDADGFQDYRVGYILKIITYRSLPRN